MKLDAGSCRSCHAPISWAQTAKGRRIAIPLDPGPTAHGNLILTDQERGLSLAVVVTGAELKAARAAGETWISHFATCPDARRHRRSSKR